MTREEVVALASYRMSKAHDMLRSARLLHNSGDFASSVNRSYYAVFTAARALLALKELDSKKHSGVISLFFLHYVKPGIIGRDVSDVILSAKDLREDADYSDYIEISSDDAFRELEKAERFVRVIEISLGKLLSEG